MWNGIVNICKSGFGTSVLIMPYVFMKSGVLLAMILMCITGVMSYYSWARLIDVIQSLEQ